jgi:hypothetical protein
MKENLIFMKIYLYKEKWMQIFKKIYRSKNEHYVFDQETLRDIQISKMLYHQLVSGILTNKNITLKLNNILMIMTI